MLQEYWASTVIFIGIFSQCPKKLSISWNMCSMFIRIAMIIFSKKKVSDFFFFLVKGHILFRCLFYRVFGIVWRNNEKIVILELI